MEKKTRIIVITGPESTGKTTLAADLAIYFGGYWIPEYAREYVSSLKQAYTYEDVENIARHQLGVLDDPRLGKYAWIFLDTDLIILKVWFQEVYNRVPDWLEMAISERKVDGYLLCATDLPWLPDPVRENPGHRREILFRRYQEELQKYRLIYRIVCGTGPERTRRAAHFVREMMGSDPGK